MPVESWVSLISLAVGVVALILSVVMAVLSWLFYASARDSAEKAAITIVKIEGVVAALQVSMSDVVGKAVEFWVKGGNSRIDALDGTQDALNEKLENIEDAIKSNSSVKSDVAAAQILELKKMISEISIGAKEDAIRSAFGYYGERSVFHSQEIKSGSSDEQAGVITLNVVRPTKVATAPIQFFPEFMDAPDVTVDIVSVPPEAIGDFSLKAGRATKRSCNVHLTSQVPLALGEYQIEFVAKVTQKSLSLSES